MKKELQFIISLGITLALTGSTFVLSQATQRQQTQFEPRAAGSNAVFLSFEFSGKNTNRVAKKGNTFSLPIVLNTQNQKVFGTDAVIKFDPQYLQVVDTDNTAPGIQIIRGTIFPKYFVNKADNDKGVIRLSGASFTGGKDAEVFSGLGTLGKITFRAVKEGETQVYFEFQKAAKDDSNVVSMKDTQQDLLERTTFAEITVQ